MVSTSRLVASKTPRMCAEICARAASSRALLAFLPAATLVEAWFLACAMAATPAAPVLPACCRAPFSVRASAARSCAGASAECRSPSFLAARASVNCGSLDSASCCSVTPADAIVASVSRTGPLRSVCSAGAGPGIPLPAPTGRAPRAGETVGFVEVAGSLGGDRLAYRRDETGLVEAHRPGAGHVVDTRRLGLRLLVVGRRDRRLLCLPRLRRRPRVNRQPAALAGDPPLDGQETRIVVGLHPDRAHRRCRRRAGGQPLDGPRDGAVAGRALQRLQQGRPIRSGGGRARRAAGGGRLRSRPLRRLPGPPSCRGHGEIRLTPRSPLRQRHPAARTRPGPPAPRPPRARPAAAPRRRRPRRRQPPV